MPGGVTIARMELPMFTFHPATPDDADQIAEIVIKASHGVVDHLLGGLIPGLSSKALLSAAFVKGEGPYTTDNIIKAVREGVITGLLFSYPAKDQCVPPLMESYVSDKRLKVVRPILERAVPGSLYINTLWIAEGFYRRGYGSALLLEAESRCRTLGYDSLSLFCWNDDNNSLAFLARHGFSIHAPLPRELVPLEGHTEGGSLLYKKLGQS